MCLIINLTVNELCSFNGFHEGKPIVHFISLDIKSWLSIFYTSNVWGIYFSRYWVIFLNIKITAKRYLIVCENIITFEFIQCTWCLYCVLSCIITWATWAWLVLVTVEEVSQTILTSIISSDNFTAFLVGSLGIPWRDIVEAYLVLFNCFNRILVIELLLNKWYIVGGIETIIDSFQDNIHFLAVFNQ